MARPDHLPTTLFGKEYVWDQRDPNRVTLTPDPFPAYLREQRAREAAAFRKMIQDEIDNPYPFRTYGTHDYPPTFDFPGDVDARAHQAATRGPAAP